MKAGRSLRLEWVAGGSSDSGGVFRTSGLPAKRSGASCIAKNLRVAVTQPDLWSAAVTGGSIKLGDAAC
jgi:hypothetical protein